MEQKTESTPCKQSRRSPRKQGKVPIRSDASRKKMATIFTKDQACFPNALTPKDGYERGKFSTGLASPSTTKSLKPRCNGSRKRRLQLTVTVLKIQFTVKVPGCRKRERYTTEPHKKEKRTSNPICFHNMKKDTITKLSATVTEHNNSCLILRCSKVMYHRPMFFTSNACYQ